MCGLVQLYSLMVPARLSCVALKYYSDALVCVIPTLFHPSKDIEGCLSQQTRLDVKTQLQDNVRLYITEVESWQTV